MSEHEQPGPIEQREPIEQGVLDLAVRVFGLARAGEAEELAAYVDAGVPADLTNEKGDTLLILAAYHGHPGTVAALLERGADHGRYNDRGQTPLAGAAFKGDLEMAKLLLAHGARAEAPLGDGKTAFMMAAMFNRLDIMQLLVDHGADPEARDYRGIAAIDAAQQTGAGDAVEWLRARATAQ